MKPSHQALFRYLGWNTQGDLGPYTFYTSKRKGLVWYLRAPPTKPPTLRQRIQHARWNAAAKCWSNQTAATRATWELATHSAHLRITGLNLFMYYLLTNDLPAIRTVEQQTGLELLTL